MDRAEQNSSAAAAAVVDETSSVGVGRQRAQSCSSRHTLPSPTGVRPGGGGAAPSRRSARVVRRLSPAAVEAARLAVAARQAYARRESSRSMGETALFIVTSDAGVTQQTLDEQDVALLLQSNRCVPCRPTS